MIIKTEVNIDFTNSLILAKKFLNVAWNDLGDDNKIKVWMPISRTHMVLKEFYLEKTK